MDFSLSSGELMTFATAVVAASIVAGLLAGVFGIGGGAILVPVMYHFFVLLDIEESIRIQIAIATSLGIIVPTSLRSFFAQKKRGAVDLVLLRDWAIPVPVGVALASLVAFFASGDSLKGIFAVIALGVASRMIFNRASWRLGDDLPENPWRALVGAVTGFFSTLMGIGGGIMCNTFMTLYGRPIHQAVATSAGVGVLVSIPGVIGWALAGWRVEGLPPLSIGYVNLIGIALVIPITMVMAPLGVRLAHALPKRALEISFGVFLLTVSAQFFYAMLA